MGAVLKFVDRLANVMSGMGTSRDPRAALRYVFTPMTADQAEAAYRTSWLPRKIVDIPALDMTREWRRWQAEATDIEEIEAEEKRLSLREKCKRALILSRLYGGGAIVLGDGSGKPEEPVNPQAIRKGGLRYVHVMSRHELSHGEEILDPESVWFRMPEWFEIQGGRTRRIRLHPSRVVPFVGQPAPEGSRYRNDSWFWGDPVMLSIGEAVKNADVAQAGFAALIDEARNDIIRIPDLMSMWATDEHEQQLMKRLAGAQTGKSTWRALVLDKDEEWEQRQVTWTGIPDVLMAFLNIVAGAADIPVTRLLGQSPKGLQSTGEGEEKDYQAMVKARQDELLAPALDRIDELLIRSALGSRPSDVYYEFGELVRTTDKEAAEIEERAAKTVETYAKTGLIPDVALSAMAKNRIIESGRWPGSEAAFEEAARELEEPNDGDEGDLGLKATNPDGTPKVRQAVAEDFGLPKNG